MDTKQVADMLGVSRSQVYKLVELGKIPHVRIMSKIVFNRSAVTKWLDQQTVPAK